ncbi:hypothetical protein JVU11DRAFT_10562 [Chiua virens]|nr:hypothetical protein JVU11DRAFT_10562 [Chiua virens]
MGHRCLNVVEVQQTIFVEVLDKPRGKGTLAKLARTCHRTLSNTALNVLWARLPSITYLIRCLPPELWEIEGHNMACSRVFPSSTPTDHAKTFRRLMLHSDWKIFFSYSSRVRSLSGFGGMGSCASLDLSGTTHRCLTVHRF